MSGRVWAAGGFIDGWSVVVIASRSRWLADDCDWMGRILGTFSVFFFSSNVFSFPFAVTWGQGVAIAARSISFLTISAYEAGEFHLVSPC